MVAVGRSKPVRVRDVLVAALPELRDRMLEESIRQDWHALVGAGLGRRSRPGRLKAGVLDVTVDNSPGLHEMTLRSGEVLAALQGRFGPVVGALRFALGAMPPAADEPTPPPLPKPRPALSHDEHRAVEAMLVSVPDTTLAGSLRRLVTKDLLARRRDGAPHRQTDSRPDRREES